MYKVIFDYVFCDGFKDRGCIVLCQTKDDADQTFIQLKDNENVENIQIVKVHDDYTIFEESFYDSDLEGVT